MAASSGEDLRKGKSRLFNSTGTAVGEVSSDEVEEKQRAEEREDAVEERDERE